jgi:hypothetical protein
LTISVEFDPGCVKTRRWTDSGDKILARFAGGSDEALWVGGPLH